ncbi:hypothetical protein J7E97_20915 [Streptomyces sp. ISL-66]|uniref:hypothetical protein n=1 Tax=Streptomyces sp. ISL-66 TaxID=2819186 RepID=UPI001BED30A7|nr:hypothetical protein [Streptomyces sp. ISL-66]MBT2470267.1 hypothetical protein [Streptomyces sp. ISL-66]
MARRIQVAALVREQFKGVDLPGIKRRLATKKECCRACGKSIGSNSPANLIAVIHRESRIKWAALVHPQCGNSGIYTTSIAPDDSRVYFEIECALMAGERGAVPALIVDAYGGYKVTGSGEVHDTLLAGFARFGFDYPDWIDREDSEAAQAIDETEHTPGLTAHFESGEMLISSEGAELFRMNNLNYYPRWYRSLKCGALFVSIGRNLQGMTFDSLKHIQRAASAKELVSAVAAVSVVPANLSSTCGCVNGATRTFAVCCGHPDGPEE